jgi:hypothetical protein
MVKAKKIYLIKYLSKQGKRYSKVKVVPVLFFFTENHAMKV